ncbi:MAG TPA: NAD(P)(+) transhydrogenase (Re/Si-specific) subunit beta, partial [Planctomycetota bacterium]|nr:NAD(P)(+) transhydrogenase (Re/Si-specific) subunit beta [Planctomycetota bacterium]
MYYLYLLATLLFVIGIKQLTSVRTCQRGNRISEVGMLLAIVSVLTITAGVNWYTVMAGILVGAGLGALIAKRTPTTAMPEMVGALHGCGGLASAIVAMAFLIIDPVLKIEGKSLWDTGTVN